MPDTRSSMPLSRRLRSDAPTSEPAAATPTLTLYQRQSHPYQPRNANEAHAAERTMAAGRSRVAAINEVVAVWVTAHVGTMLCAYIFLAIGVGSLVGVFTNNALLAAVCGSVSSYVLQLVLLPVIQLGSNLLSRHAELQADEQFHATMRTLHESEQVMRHLDAQDRELLRQSALLLKLTVDAASSTSSAAAAAAAIRDPTPAPAVAPTTAAPRAAAATKRPSRKKATS